MSSDPTDSVISIADISLIKDVLRNMGFRYEDPICELDRQAARHVMADFQRGVQARTDLIASLTLWADRASLPGRETRAREMSL